jgi:hypothetical protein
VKKTLCIYPLSGSIEYWLRFYTVVSILLIDLGIWG